MKIAAVESTVLTAHPPARMRWTNDQKSQMDVRRWLLLSILLLKTIYSILLLVIKRTQYITATIMDYLVDFVP